MRRVCVCEREREREREREKEREVRECVCASECVACVFLLGAWCVWSVVLCGWGEWKIGIFRLCTRVAGCHTVWEAFLHKSSFSVTDWQ